MNLHWFVSAKARHATHMWKHVRKLVCAQRDLLSAEAVRKLDESIESLRGALRVRASKAELETKMVELEKSANTWLKPYPQAGIRENVEVLLVAIAVAMAIRTFIAQPFKIPTGSMQPTLYGVTSENLRDVEDFEMPPAWKRYLMYWFTGVAYDHIVAKEDGDLKIVEDVPRKFLLFNWKQTFMVGNEAYTVKFPADNLLKRAGLMEGPRRFRKGETILKLKSYSGDHLFVDRLTYNFRRPTRGEIIVFETKNIPLMRHDQLGQFYIKRLVGLGGDQIRIGNDRHLVINGQRLDASTPHFEGVYSFDPAQPPTDSHYSGHLNQAVANANGMRYSQLAPLFEAETNVFTIPPAQYMVMGDNTVNSLDSREWGSFPRENVIGRAFFVYWPIGAQDNRPSRFGWGNR